MPCGGGTERECVAYLDNKASTRRDDETRAKVLLAFFGEQCDVRSLTARDQAAYTARREAGGITLADGTTMRAVRARSVEMDLVLLHAMLSWATTVRLPNGGRLLEANPLSGVRREREQNPVRPVASWERFERTRTAMQQLQREAAARRAADERPILSELEEMRWVKMELALVLAEATGRRLGSIRQLRWEDVDFERGTIRWRAEFDKKGKEWVVPMSDALADELRQFRKRLGAITGWIFTGERKSEQPMDRHLLTGGCTPPRRRPGCPSSRVVSGTRTGGSGRRSESITR